MKKKLLLCSLLTLSLGVLASCQQTNSNSNSISEEEVVDPKDLLDEVPTEIDHYFSNKISFADLGVSLTDKFMQNKVAKLQLKSVTDGDTAVFYLSGGEQDNYTNVLGRSYGYLTVRFLAIDTPESTSSIAPWGKKASKYVKDLLKNSKSVIVDASSIDTEGMSVTDTFKSGIRLDSNGTRWLGMIWYCPKDKDDNDLSNFRSLQLDVIEECYSSYTGNLGGNQFVYTANPETEPKLYERYKDTYGSMTLSEVLLEADVRSRTLEVRKTGNQLDDNYDYSKNPQEATIKDAYDHWDEWESNAKFLQLTGVITRFIGNNFYFQDGNGYPLYVYMGIEGKSINSMFQVGDTISIRGRLATYGGQKQMTDIVWAKETFVKVTDANLKVAMPEPINLGTKTIYSQKELDDNIGKLVTIELTADGVGNTSKDGSYTLYASETVSELTAANYQYDKLSVRVNGSLAPGYDNEEMSTYWEKGSKYVVTGILAIYGEDDYTKEQNFPSYQITVGNRNVINNDELESEIVKK